MDLVSDPFRSDTTTVGELPRVAVGVACAADPGDPQAFSGTPASLLAALRSMGHTPVGVAAQLSPRTQRFVQLALAGANVRVRDVRDAPDGVAAAKLRTAWRISQTRLLASPSLKRIRTLAARRAVGNAGSIVGCIQFGTDFELPAGVGYVTYDDQTVLQAAGAYDYSWITALRERDVTRLVERQRRIFSGARACCATSHWAAKSIVEDYGVPSERVFVVGVGATHVADPGPRDWAVPRFLFVGKDWERKNGDEVVRAFSALRRTHPAATLDIVGAHPPLDEPGVTGHGLLRADRPADVKLLRGLFATATCFVLPSLHEPSALSYVEAAAAGIGAIGTTSGGAATLIGDAGTVVDPSDSGALRNAMLEFADTDTARRLGQLASERAARFTWEAVAERLVAALLATEGVRFL